MTHFDIAYEGKAKQLILIDGDRDHYVQRFKDDATAFNGEKSAKFAGKGALNCAISSFIFEKLEAANIPTHYLGQQNPIDMRVRKLEIIPLEVVVRNSVAGNLSRRTGLAQGDRIEPPIVETYYKNDALGDPLFADTHIEMLGLVDAANLARIKDIAFRVNTVLRPLFADAGIELVDFKIEFGIDAAGQAVLGDEISPDTCRLWDMQTGQSLDKDVFRYDKGDLIQAYEEVARRLDLKVASGD